MSTVWAVSSVRVPMGGDADGAFFTSRDGRSVTRHLFAIARLEKALAKASDADYAGRCGRSFNVRFLVTSTPKFPIPPDAVSGLLNAMNDWTRRYTAAKRIEQTWGFVGGGGGGILDVASHEELNTILTEMPFAPFADTKVEPLLPMEVSLNNFRQAMARLSQPA